jgi:hypothetical protein
MLHNVMLSVIMQSVIMLSVMAPSESLDVTNCLDPSSKLCLRRVRLVIPKVNKNDIIQGVG